MDKNETKTQHDLYLQEIEGIDDYWGPTFRYLIRVIKWFINFAAF